LAGDGVHDGGGQASQPWGFAVDVVGGEVEVDAVLDDLAFGYLMEREAGAGAHEVAGQDDSIMRVRAFDNLTSEHGGPELRDLGRVVASKLMPTTVVLVMIVTWLW
jgi:hypothetical protein